MRKLPIVPFLLGLLLISACGGGSSSGAASNSGGGGSPAPTPDPAPTPPTEPPVLDFSALDARIQRFIDKENAYGGVAYSLVDSNDGVVHESAAGNYTTDTIVLLSSASMMPGASLLMALNDEPSLDFDIQSSIDNYLPWKGVYGDRTTEQLLSNTSGIPGFTSYAYNRCQLDVDARLGDCAEEIYTTLLPGTMPAGSTFDFGGSPWHLAGGLAEKVSNSSLRQAFDKYIAQPCELDVFQFGNMGFSPNQWSGQADSLVGLDNPSLATGAITNIQDYTKILLMHLRRGKCGDQQVLSARSVDLMLQNYHSAIQRVDGIDVNWGYGIGWWITDDPGVYVDFGLYGSVAWIDITRGIGGYLAAGNYNRGLNELSSSLPATVGLLVDIIRLHQDAVDAFRAGSEEVFGREIPAGSGSNPQEPPPQIPRVALDHEYNFESGNFSLACSGNCPTVTSKVAREGTYAMESYLNRNTSTKSFRTEAVIPGAAQKMQFNRDYWIGFSVYLPTDWEVSETFEMIAQIHSTLDENDKPIGQPFSIDPGSGTWKILSRGENIRTRQWFLNDISEDYGKWTDWVIHYKPSYESQGVLEVWKNGEKVVQKIGPNTYRDAIGPYFKMGVYLGWKDRDCCDDKKPEKLLYHDALRIASGPNATYADVAPR